MKNYPYLERLMQASSIEKVKFVHRVAKRALEGGDAQQLFDICKITAISNAVLNIMVGEEGCMLLHLRLWFRHHDAWDISDFDDWFGRYECADDADDCIDWLVSNDIITRCDDCGAWELKREVRSYFGDNNAEICRSCIENEYRWSEYYENYVYSDSSRDAFDENGNRCVIHEDDGDFEYSDDDEEYYHVDYNPANRVIGNYHSSKGMQRPQVSDWTKMKKRYLGVELEVEVLTGYDRRDKAMALHRKINDEMFGANVFFENDGSLTNGFEIISQPMGMDKHREVWRWLKERDSVRGMRSHNTSTCGLHVHVSKDGLSKLQIAKIVAFVNDPENEDLIRAVARRYAEGYCRIKAKKIGQSAESNDRYEAINITPRKTIEFRIFKGSLKYESVMAAIQFSNSLVEFCGRSTTSIRELKAEKFLEFIRSDESGDTDVLVPYLENRLETA